MQISNILRDFVSTEIKKYAPLRFIVAIKLSFWTSFSAVRKSSILKCVQITNSFNNLRLRMNRLLPFGLSARKIVDINCHHLHGEGDMAPISKRPCMAISIFRFPFYTKN